MTKALITGSGMVASALADALGRTGSDHVMVSHDELDITDRQAVKSKIAEERPEAVFHTAALTKVNYCEQHPEEAIEVNSEGTRHVVDAASELGCAVVYFSTDYVFDGTKDEPWLEDDEPNPVNAYGRSKLAGEKHVVQYRRGHVIRTSGVFGPRSDGRPEMNFIRAIAAKLVANDDVIPVIGDQFTCITYAPHLASMALELAQQSPPKLAHLTSSGLNSWHGWACEVASALGYGTGRVKLVPSNSEGTGTLRPAFSVLKSSRPRIRAMVEEHCAVSAIREYLDRL